MCDKVVAVLTVDDPQTAMSFYSKLLGGKQIFSVKSEDGRIAHGTLQFRDAVGTGAGMIYIHGEFPEINRVSPKRSKGSSISVSLNIAVANAKATHRKALKSGCKEVTPVTKQFWGDVSGTVLDPFGHQLTFLTPYEKPRADEIVRRAAKSLGPQE